MSPISYVLRWGKLIACWPKLTIALSLLVCAVFTGGLAFWYQEMDQEVLWTPYNSPVRVTVKVEVLKDVFFSVH